MFRFLFSILCLIFLSGCGSEQGSPSVPNSDDIASVPKEWVMSIPPDEPPALNLSLIGTKVDRLTNGLLEIPDQKRPTEYVTYRDFIYLGPIGVGSVEAHYGYQSGAIYLDLGHAVIQLPVDEDTFISFNTPFINRIIHYPGTGFIRVDEQLRMEYPQCEQEYQWLEWLDQQPLSTDDQSESVDTDDFAWRDQPYHDGIDGSHFRCIGRDQHYLYARNQQTTTHSPIDINILHRIPIKN